MKIIPLSQGQVALVDDADFEAVNAFKWCAFKRRKGFHAARKVRRADGSWATQYLHQFLLPGIPQIDHKDGNGLNNQRQNLRPATAIQNRQGFRSKSVGATSAYRGVSWYSRDKVWEAQISNGG